MKIKTIIAALCIAAAGQSAFAGSLADPIIEAPIVVEAATSSSSGTALVLALAVLLALPVAID